MCLNGCTDDSEQVTADAARTDQRIRVLSSAKGKTYAWNELYRTARHELVVFLDADIALAPDTIAKLLRELHDHPDLAIVAGRAVARGGNLATRLFVTPIRSDNLMGRVYGVRRTRLSALMIEQGFVNDEEQPHMPAGLMVEDFWLRMVAAPDAISFPGDAVVYFHPGDWQECLMAIARDRVGVRMMLRDHPVFLARHRSLAPQFTRRARIKWVLRGKPSNGLSGIGGALLRRAVSRQLDGRLSELTQAIEAECSRTGAEAILSGPFQTNRHVAE